MFIGGTSSTRTQRVKGSLAAYSFVGIPFTPTNSGARKRDKGSGASNSSDSGCAVGADLPRGGRARLVNSHQVGNCPCERLSGSKT